MKTKTIFDFKTQHDISNWNTIDDVVMGGKSNGVFLTSPEGYGLFKGDVSLENNGGFSMVQYKFETQDASAFNSFEIKLKGDGKSYQFRVKTTLNDKHAYIFPFDTNNDWQTLKIPFDKMTPAYRGKALDMENYPGKTMEMIGFLIGNKKAESFKLEIDSIKLI